MNISMVGPSYPFRGGIAHYTTLLYQALKKRHQASFFAFTRQYPSWLFPGKTDKDVSDMALKDDTVIPALDSMNPFTWVNVFFKIRAARPDLVLIPWWVSFWTPQFWTIVTLVKIFLKVPVLFLCHNVVAHESSGFDKWCTRRVLKKGEMFIVHSDEDMRNLRAIVPDKPARKTYHPTYEVFNAAPMSKHDAREKVGVSGNVLLFFGFVREYKGLRYVLEALPLVLKKLPLTLLIVGEFWKGKEAYLEQIASLGIGDHVRIVDEYVPNEHIGDYFYAADLVMMPYVSGTGSGIAQIAFGFDKPVIATDVGCLPDVVADGVSGYIVPPRNAQALADAVCRFYEEAKEEEFTRNVINEKEKFSWDRMVEVIEDLVNTDTPRAV